MSHRTRLGPAAIFLTIISMIIVTLTLLTVSTTNADLVMADKYAEVTKTRYALRADGETFLCEASEAALTGQSLTEIAGVKAADDGYVYAKETNGYKLEVEISRPDGNGCFDVRDFRISKIWNSQDPAADIWKGSDF